MTARPARSRVLVRPRNAREYADGELDALVAALQKRLGAGYRVGLVPETPKFGRGLTYWEILQIWLQIEPYAKGAAGYLTLKAIDKAVDIFVDWAREHRRKKKSRRPSFVTIHGPDGRVLKAVLIPEKGRHKDVTADHAQELELPPADD